MKMLYVLSPPHTPPPSPWTSMRDSSPPLSCPSSNSNSSSSINSSYSYSSSQSGRDNTSTRNRIGKENSSQSRLNSGSGVSTRSKLESFPQSARNSSTKNNIHTFNGNSGDEYSRENSGRVASVVPGGGKSRLLSGGETSSSVNSSQRKDGCSNVSRGDLGSARHFQWKKFESKSCDVDVHSSKTLPHICNSQSEKIFPGRRHHLEHPVRPSQSERRGSTLTDHQAEKRDSTGGDGRARVVCRSKQSKATRIWLNAIAKANARGTSAVPSGHIGGDERDLFGDDSDFIGESEPIGGAERGDGKEREGSVGRGKKEDAEVALPAERHFGKNVKKCRLKRKDSGTGTSTEDEETSKPSSRRLSECYFAVALPFNPHPPRVSSPSSDIQKHLQSMFQVLRPQETLKMAVKLESVHPERTRYLVVVSCDEQGDESCLLGIDCNETTTVGLVLRVLADTSITLDGDGGFSVCVCGRQHIFKPVSVQAMWSALQSLHKVSSVARDKNYFLNGGSHEWVSQYEAKISSDRSCLNEWHAMDCLESRRPPSPSPHGLRDKPSQRDQTERTIRNTLKEIIMSVDLDEVTSKYIRSRLEDIMNSDLGEYKSFIDQEMLYILKQMDAATEIFPHVYLGSEWNASNLEELARNGVCHILNVTREIDNFFPGEFNYLNIRVYDDDKTDLLKHWDDTYKYITNAKNQGSKVLVHCKMGISRSASVVIAYAMKAYNWELSKAMTYVRQKRNCIKPNANFIAQLETYQGILDAMKNREKLQRSKSETNLKCNLSSSSNARNNGQLSRSNVETRSSSVAKEEAAQFLLNSSLSETPPPSPTHNPFPHLSPNYPMLEITPGSNYSSGTNYPLLSPGSELAQGGSRPKSWSPDALEVSTLFETSAPTSQSLEHLSDVPGPPDTQPPDISPHGRSPPNLPTPSSPPIPPAPPLPPAPRMYNSNVRMPCGNGLAYSVSQNKVLHLACSQSPRTCEGGVKSRVHALEANASTSHWSDRLVLPISSVVPPPSSSQASFLAQQIASAKQAVESGGGKASRTVETGSSKVPSLDQKSSATFAPAASGGNLTTQLSPQPPSHHSSQVKPPTRFARKILKFICKEKSHSSPHERKHCGEKEPRGGNGEKIPPTCPPVEKNPASSSPSGKNKTPVGNTRTLTRQDSCSSADSAIVSDYVSRQGSWGSGELVAGRTQSLGAYDGDARVSLPPLCKNTGESHQAVTQLNTLSHEINNEIEPFLHSCEKKLCDKQFNKQECVRHEKSNLPPVSCQTLQPSHCECSANERNSSQPLVYRKPNRICNCFRRNSDGEGQSMGQDSYTLGNADSKNVYRNSSVSDPNVVGNMTIGGGILRGDESGKNTSSNTLEGNSDSRVADARGKFDSRGTKSYDSEQIMAASSCISSVILRKKFLPSTIDPQSDLENYPSSCPGNQNESGKHLESVHRQGNSTFYVNNESNSSHRGSNELKSSRDTRNISSQSVSSRSFCESSNLNATESLSRESKAQHTVSSNTLVVSVPPSRPLSQTLFNYSNSYPQPFSSSNKLKNNQLSRSYPSVLGQNVSLATKSTGSDEKGSERRSTGSSCLERNPSQPFCDKESQGQMNLNRVPLTTSTQSLNSVSSHKRECPKRSLSVEEKRKKLPSPGGTRKESSYGIVRNLKDEFEAKNGNVAPPVSAPGFQHIRNHSSSSCCSCGDNAAPVEGNFVHSEGNFTERVGNFPQLDNSAAVGETRNINNLCDSEDDVFRSQTNAHEDSSNNNEVPRSLSNVDETRKLPAAVKKIPRNPATSHNSAGIPPVGPLISPAEHKKSVRNIVGKFEQKSDREVTDRPKTVVVDSVTNFIKYIDDIKTKQEEGALVEGRVLVEGRAGKDATSGVVPPIYNTM